MNDWDPKKLRDFFTNFDPNNPNHLAAADMLQSHVPGVMNDGADWVKLFRKKASPKSTGAKVPQEALDLIKKYEGFRSGPYICPAGVPTIGYGSTYYPSGQKVTLKDPPISQADAESILRKTVEKDFLPSLEKIPYWSEMSDGQRSALISFSYNLGANFYGDMANFTTITNVLKYKDWPDVPDALLLYRNPGSSFEEGLKRRRKEEGEVWAS